MLFVLSKLSLSLGILQIAPPPPPSVPGSPSTQRHPVIGVNAEPKAGFPYTLPLLHSATRSIPMAPTLGSLKLVAACYGASSSTFCLAQRHEGVQTKLNPQNGKRMARRSRPRYGQGRRTCCMHPLGSVHRHACPTQSMPPLHSGDYWFSRNLRNVRVLCLSLSFSKIIQGSFWSYPANHRCRNEICK